MLEDTTRGNQNLGTDRASKTTTKPTSDGFTVRYTPVAGAPRKLGFELTPDGDWLRIESRWTGCRWMEIGYERCSDVEFEVPEEAPDAVVAPVLEALFDAAFEGGATDLDVLNALANEAFGEEIVRDSIARVEANGGDA